MGSRAAIVTCLALLVACGGHAPAPTPVAKPDVAVAASGPATASQPVPIVEAIVVEEPPPEPPPPPEPVLPPCPANARDKDQRPDHVVALAELAKAMTVVDLGSGDGYFLCHLSRAVGARGRVIATEISTSQVRALTKRAEREQLANVEVVKAPFNDVGIATGTADRILLVNVWHHLPDRKKYATKIAAALAPGGKLVILDFKPAKWRGGHGILPERILAELAAGGIEAALLDEQLSDQYVIIGAARTKIQ